MKPFRNDTVLAVSRLLTHQLHPDVSLEIVIPRVRFPLSSVADFLNVRGVDEKITNDLSRLENMHKALSSLNVEQPEFFVRLVQRTANWATYLDFPEQQQALVKYLNRRFERDGFALQKEGSYYRLRPLVSNSVAVAGLQSLLGSGGYQSVQRELERALPNVDTDPEDTITAAGSMVESACKIILDQMGKPYPKQQTLTDLSKAVADNLGLLPADDDNDKHVKQILQGLASIAQGTAALRNAVGDAHGRGMTRTVIEPRVARLAVNAASTLTAFYIETWEAQAKHGEDDASC